MTLMVVRHTSMGINNCLLGRVPVWQGFSGRIIPIAPRVRRNSSGFLLAVLSKARQRILPTL